MLSYADFVIYIHVTFNKPSHAHMKSIVTFYKSVNTIQNNKRYAVETTDMRLQKGSHVALGK